MPVRKPNSYRNGRVNEEIARELTDILRTVKDPRVSGAFISILRVETGNDLKQSKIHYSVLGGDEKVDSFSLTLPKEKFSGDGAVVKKGKKIFHRFTV